MITVSVAINGQPIFTRSAVNQGDCEGNHGMHAYKVDDGSVIRHRRSDGAVALAIKLLKLIKEPTSAGAE